MDPFQAYVICTSPRSGSTLLCSLLRGTGKAGFPESYFHTPSVSEWLGNCGLRPEDYSQQKDALNAVFSAICELGKGGTDIFGLRLQRHSFDYFTEQLRILQPSQDTARSRFDAAFGKTLFINLTRENKLEQAISYVRAEQSGLWHKAPDGTELERLPVSMESGYDYQAIATRLAEFIAMDRAWDAWFAAEKIRPLRITYDELSSNPHSTLKHVLNVLGHEYQTDNKGDLPLSKLADATNHDWAERFRAESPDCGY